MTRWILLFLSIILMSIIAVGYASDYPEISFVALLIFTAGATVLAIFARRAPKRIKTTEV